MKKINSILRTFLGLVLILLAVSKFLTIDNFEIFIYSLNLFSFNVSSIVSRLLLSIELIFGVFLVLNFYFKIIKNIILLFLITSTLYLLLTEKTNSCYFFGEIFELSIFEYLIKNITLFVIIIFIKTQDEFIIRFKRLIQIFIIIAFLLIPNIISSPDFINNAIYSHQTVLNKAEFNKLIKIDKNDISNGKKMVCFYSSKCKYCNLLVNKISIIINKYNIKYTDVFCYFWGDKKDTEMFFKKNNSKVYPFTYISPDIFLKITNGKMPVVVLIKNGIVIKTYGYRNINEKEIKLFFEDE